MLQEIVVIDARLLMSLNCYVCYRNSFDYLGSFVVALNVVQPSVSLFLECVGVHWGRSDSGPLSKKLQRLASS